MIDVDFFKKYNDLYGHLAGDACLRRIAGTIRDCVRRGTDLVARFGGEEFVALLPMTNAAGGAQLATKILQGIAGLAMPHLDSPHGVVTISIGVSSWPAGSPLEPELLMERADRALYQAKERGRNTFAIG
jgi:diguanylate cyclase (GGDEF)-like protein